MQALFTPVTIGANTLRNRIVMSPMTRSRADDATGVPADITRLYYAQRANAGLIVTEGVFPSPMGKGYVRTPGIHSPEQIAAWKSIADAVHAEGGLIFMQLMHSGRISHPSMLPDGATPVAPSAVKPAGAAWTNAGQQDFGTPRALSTDEVAAVVQDYRSATRNAMAAGFDGVELHAASGYLPEQFLSSATNERGDRYGGSLENRARFVLEVLQAMVDEAGAGRVGIKISPEMGFNDIRDESPQETYRYLVEKLAPLPLAYLHVALFKTSIDYHALLRPLFKGAYLHGGGLNKDSAQALVESRRADATVFGSLYIANPDLALRLHSGAELSAPDPQTFYSAGPQGYIDYPALEAAAWDGSAAAQHPLALDLR